jgi:hypothetical protein
MRVDIGYEVDAVGRVGGIAEVSRVHAAIVDARVAGGLLDGRKRLESRFARQRRLPYGRISVGDEIYFKVSGSVVIGHSAVLGIREFENLTPATITAIRRRYNHVILAPSAYWRARRNSRFGVLIWLGPSSGRRSDAGFPGNMAPAGCCCRPDQPARASRQVLC